MNVEHYAFEVVIVGAGGAGLYAALPLAKAGISVAVISKVFPTRSHTVSAQGGVTAALGNMDEDNWHWHMFDTVKGGDYLGDQEAIEFMCQQGPELVYELEHMGLPFSRGKDGRIYQRPFGGQSKNFGGAQATRTCAAADRTGHALLHTLYQKNLEAKTTFFSEWYALDLIANKEGHIAGITALNIETGGAAAFQSKAVVLATGGAGRIYRSTTNALINTGDGLGMALRAGFPLQDMEMWQFHPTGVAGVGCLITEGVRGEGGYLINGQGERFMERYAPNAKDLASRDVISRAITIELLEGRGCGPQKDHVLLKLDHLGEETIQSKLPGIRELAQTFAHVDPIHDPIPVVPTSHYMMGGIPTDKYGQVLTVEKEGQERKVDGLYAVGECACVSVHGANRLGGNSLLDLVVFGKAAGTHILQTFKNTHGPFVSFSEENVSKSFARLNRWNNSEGDETVEGVQRELQDIMQSHFGVFRKESHMQKGLDALLGLRERVGRIRLRDKSQTFNTARIEALEFDNLMAVALATAHSALCRKESRGAHSRDDYPKRDDVNWLKHIVYAEGKRLCFRSVNDKPQTVSPFLPKARSY
ncbi:MAG: succinate dehydrogenase flavoprotein subunit [Gammaproteobacteria bacterium]|nr:succinate dehydrogenase flavoprotein subunit [Gammaproteobacteria bacterium]